MCINVLSLFDGISVAQQALHNLNINNTYYSSEIDKYAIGVTQKNFPNTIMLGDVKNINISSSPHISLLIGGSPCQDISIAKQNREGLSGSRSCLFYNYVDILRQTKPDIFVFENVNSMSKEVRDEITKNLFGIDPVMIDAALVSAQSIGEGYFG